MVNRCRYLAALKAVWMLVWEMHVFNDTVLLMSVTLQSQQCKG